MIPWKLICNTRVGRLAFKDVRTHLTSTWGYGLNGSKKWCQSSTARFRSLDLLCILNDSIFLFVCVYLCICVFLYLCIIWWWYLLCIIGWWYQADTTRCHIYSWGHMLILEPCWLVHFTVWWRPLQFKCHSTWAPPVIAELLQGKRWQEMFNI